MNRKKFLALMMACSIVITSPATMAQVYANPVDDITTVTTSESDAAHTVKTVALSGVLEKTHYLHGDEIDLTGITVKVYYTDGDTLDIDVRDPRISYDKKLTRGQTELDLTCRIDSAEYHESVTGFVVDAKPISGDMVAIPSIAYPYTGTAVTPAVAVSDGGTVLRNGIDYTVQYQDNANAGLSTSPSAPAVIVTGKGGYTGVIIKTFTIKQAVQAPLSINPVTDKEVGDTPFSLATTGGSGKGYVTYSVPKNDVIDLTQSGEVTIKSAGTVTITAVKDGDSNYMPAKTTYKLTIYPKRTDITKAKVTLGAPLVYNGKTQTQTVSSVILDGTSVGTYTVSGGSIVDAGSHELIVTGTGLYKGTIKKSFEVKKADADITLADLSQTEGSVSAVKAFTAPQSADADVTVEYYTDKSGQMTWTSDVPQTAGTYQVRAYLDAKKAGKNLIGYADYDTAAKAGKAATGTLIIKRVSTDGSVTSVQDEYRDGTAVHIETVARPDGTTVYTETATYTDGTQSVVTRTDNASGATTSVKASMTMSGRVSITKQMVETVKAATGTDTDIIITVTDTKGQTYTVTVSTGDLKSGKKLAVLKKGGKSGYVLVDSRTYTVSADGALTMTSGLKKSGRYYVKSSTVAKQTEQKALASVKSKKSAIALKSKKTAKAALSSKLDKANVKSITYSSSNARIAKVSKSGTVKAYKKGTAYVKVKVTLINGTSKTVKIKVSVS